MTAQGKSVARPAMSTGTADSASTEDDVAHAVFIVVYVRAGGGKCATGHQHSRVLNLHHLHDGFLICLLHCFVLHLLFDEHLFTVHDVEPLGGRSAAEAATIQRVPTIVANFSNFVNSDNFLNPRGLVVEVQHDASDSSGQAGVASRDAIQFEHGAAGAYRHVSRRIVEFVVCPEVEHAPVASRQADGREGAYEIDIVGRDACQSVADGDIREHRVFDVIARCPLHKVRLTRLNGSGILEVQRQRAAS